MNSELKIKKIILEVLQQLPPPYDVGYEEAIQQYLNEVETLLKDEM